MLNGRRSRAKSGTGGIIHPPLHRVNRLPRARVRPKTVRAVERKGRKEKGGCGIARRRLRARRNLPPSSASVRSGAPDRARPAVATRCSTWNNHHVRRAGQVGFPHLFHVEQSPCPWVGWTISHTKTRSHEERNVRFVASCELFLTRSSRRLKASHGRGCGFQPRPFPRRRSGDRLPSAAPPRAEWIRRFARTTRRRADGTTSNHSPRPEGGRGAIPSSRRPVIPSSLAVRRGQGSLRFCVEGLTRSSRRTMA